MKAIQRLNTEAIKFRFGLVVNHIQLNGQLSAPYNAVAVQWTRGPHMAETKPFPDVTNGGPSARFELKSSPMIMICTLYRNKGGGSYQKKESKIRIFQRKAAQGSTPSKIATIEVDIVECLESPENAARETSRDFHVKVDSAKKEYGEISIHFTLHAQRLQQEGEGKEDDRTLSQIGSFAELPSEPGSQVGSKAERYDDGSSGGNDSSSGRKAHNIVDYVLSTPEPAPNRNSRKKSVLPDDAEKELQRVRQANALLCEEMDGMKRELVELANLRREVSQFRARKQALEEFAISNNVDDQQKLRFLTSELDKMQELLEEVRSAWSVSDRQHIETQKLLREELATIEAAHQAQLALLPKMKGKSDKNMLKVTQDFARALEERARLAECLTRFEVQLVDTKLKLLKSEEIGRAHV